MKSFLDNCWSDFVAGDDKLTAYPLPDKLAAGCYDQGKLIPAVKVKPAKGWKVADNWKPADKTGTRADFTDVPMLVAESPTGILNFEFAGNAVGIAVAAGQDAGTIEYRIDKNSWKTFLRPGAQAFTYPGSIPWATT